MCMCMYDIHACMYVCLHVWGTRVWMYGHMDGFGGTRLLLGIILSSSLILFIEIGT